MNSLIVIVHVSMMLFMGVYAFVFKKSWFDYVYLAYTYLVLLHWTFLNGECIITYFFKKLENKHYIAGSDVHRDEIKVTFKGNETLIQLLIIIHNLLLMVNIYLVSKRNNISYTIYLPFILLFEVYFYGLYLFPKNPSFHLFQESVKYLLLLGLVYLIWKKSD